MATNTVQPSVIYDGLISRGFTPVQAVTLLGNMRQESSFRPGVINPKEDAFGLIQWRLDRLGNLKQFAANEGKPVTDPTVQLDFLTHEIRQGGLPGSKAFLSAKTVPDANTALKKYIAYGDDSEPTRLKYAETYAMNGFGSGGTEEASPTPVAAGSNNLVASVLPDAAPTSLATPTIPANNLMALSLIGNLMQNHQQQMQMPQMQVQMPVSPIGGNQLAQIIRPYRPQFVTSGNALLPSFG